MCFALIQDIDKSFCLLQDLSITTSKPNAFGLKLMILRKMRSFVWMGWVDRLEYLYFTTMTTDGYASVFLRILYQCVRMFFRLYVEHASNKHKKQMFTFPYMCNIACNISLTVLFFFFPDMRNKTIYRA